MVEAAEKAGVQTAVGFNYLKNPMVALAREIVAGGEIGEVVELPRHPCRGLHDRPGGALHLAARPEGRRTARSPISAATSSAIARYVVGPIESLVAADSRR